MRVLYVFAICLLIAAVAVPLSSAEHGMFDPFSVYYALREAYPDAVYGMGWSEGEAFFVVNGMRIYFLGGKMLFDKHRADHVDYDTMLYRYAPGPMNSLPAAVPHPDNRSTDLLSALLGATEREIVASCSWLEFLGRRVFMHELAADALKRVEVRVQEASTESAEVRMFVHNIRIMFSLDRRRVDGSESLSYHAFGLALDIVPKSYEGRQVYWRWTSVWKNSWDSLPLSERWQPPQAVIEAFEDEGFVWGGKWYHYDTIHFEYRPEIILLNRQLNGEEAMRE